MSAISVKMFASTLRIRIAAMDDAVFFQNLVLEFILDAPAAIADYDIANLIDWHVLHRAQDMVHILLLANGLHLELRRHVCEQVTILHLSFVATRYLSGPRARAIRSRGARSFTQPALNYFLEPDQRVSHRSNPDHHPRRSAQPL
jgi:hypothetical protein